MVHRAPFRTAGSEEALLEPPEKEDKLATSRSILRQRSSRPRDTETDQDQGPGTCNNAPEANDSPGAVSAHSETLLDTTMWGGDELDSSRATNQPTWPGPGFELKKVTPGSMYLWACGERDEDENAPSEVSHPEFCAAWVVLATQSICYVGLWIVSGDQPPVESPAESQGDGSTEGSSDYSLLAVAGAMYLMLSIAASDLWGGSALLLEGRGESGSRIHAWFWWRKAFGLALLGTFVTLIGASIRVLFYSSYENVELVIGAASVLFIADVDEKGMGVLKNVSGKWRLFWVLEVIGLSFLLAVFAIRVTGNASSVENKDDNNKYWLCDFLESACELYSWYFIINSQPIAVTVGALLATSAAATRTSSSRAPKNMPNSRHGCITWASVCAWVIFKSAFRLFAFVDLAIVVFPLLVVCAILSILAVVCLDGEDLRTHFARGAEGFRAVLKRRRFLLVGGLLLLGYGLFFRDLYQLSSQFLNLLLDVWLLSGLFLVGRTPDGGFSFSSRLSWWLMGWALDFLARLDWVEPTIVSYRFYFGEPVMINWPLLVSLRQLVRLVWSLVVGAFLLCEEAGTYGVAFWAAANRIIVPVIDCVGMWAFVWVSGRVK